MWERQQLIKRTRGRLLRKPGRSIESLTFKIFTLEYKFSIKILLTNLYKMYTKQISTDLKLEHGGYNKRAFFFSTNETFV